MPYSGPQYEADLAQMKDDVKEEKIRFYEMVSILVREGPLYVKTFGFNSVEAAVLGYHKSSERKIEKIVKDFTKKYPD